MAKNRKKVIWIAIKNCKKYVLPSLTFIDSPTFEVPIGAEITKWYLCLFPNSLETPSSMNLYLYRMDDLKLQFTFSGSLYIIGKTIKHAVHSFHHNSDKLGQCKPFLSHSKFAELFDDLVSDGKLKIGCEITISSLDQIPIRLTGSKVSDDVQRMFEEELLTDFELKCNDGQKLKCHKVILAARSPFFRSMLSNYMQEAQKGLAEVPYFDSTVMKEVLRFIYSDRVENLDNISKKLIFAAECYYLEDLKQICIRNIFQNMSRENVIEALLITEKISSCEKLFKECVAVVEGNLNEISKSRAWEKLSQDMVTKIMIELQEPFEIEFLE